MSSNSKMTVGYALFSNDMIWKCKYFQRKIPFFTENSFNEC